MSAEELTEEKTEESEHERLVRELAELLQELRVVLPGVQVLLAFLLTVPFSARFESVSQLQQTVFFGTLVCAAVSTGLLMAPSAHHRLLWRQQAKEHRLQMANRLTIAGIALLIPGIVGAMFVVSGMLFGSTAATATTAALTILLIYVWFVMPIWYWLSER